MIKVTATKTKDTSNSNHEEADTTTCQIANRLLFLLTNMEVTNRHTMTIKVIMAQQIMRIFMMIIMEVKIMTIGIITNNAMVMINTVLTKAMVAANKVDTETSTTMVAEALRGLEITIDRTITMVAKGDFNIIRINMSIKVKITTGAIHMEAAIVAPMVELERTRPATSMKKRKPHPNMAKLMIKHQTPISMVAYSEIQTERCAT